jgi:molybdenum cofactor guanylyltransferase
VAEFAAVVLAGGKSSRMGTPKAALEWHGATLLHRTVAIVARATSGPVVVVRAPGQDLPEPLPAGVLVVDDPREGKGPVQGIAAGLAALAGQAEAAFIASTDLPFLHPAFIRRVLHGLSGPGACAPDVCLPVARGYPQPLAAAYRVSLAETAERLVKAGRLRPAFLFAECLVNRLDDAALGADPVLAALDPGLDSLVNVNEPADYSAARARPAPEVTVQMFGTLARATAGDAGGRAPRVVRAATVGEAAAAVGLPLDRHVAAALNGDQVTRDALTPLAAGDTVFFMSADAIGLCHVAGSHLLDPATRQYTLPYGNGKADPVTDGMTDAFIERTREFFAVRAATWDTKFGHDMPVYAAAIAEAGIRRGGIAVDVGCGTGRALPALRTAVGPDGAVIGLELTPQMLAQARAKGWADSGDLVLADARRLPFADASVDALFAAGLVNHLPDPAAGLAEFARVTRAGGLLILFHPVGRATLAARHGRTISPEEILSSGPLRRETAAAGWDLLTYDDAADRFLAVAARR